MNSDNIYMKIYTGTVTTKKVKNPKTGKDEVVSDVECLAFVNFADSNGTWKTYTIGDLVRDSNKVEELENLGLSLTFSGNMIDGKVSRNLVALMPNKVPNEEGVHNIGLYAKYAEKALKESNQVVMDKVLEKTELTLEEVKKIVEVLVQYRAECKENKIRFDISGASAKCFGISQRAAVITLAKSADDSTVIVNTFAETSVMNSPTDKVFFRLSTARDLYRLVYGHDALASKISINPQEAFKGCDYFGLDIVSYKDTLTKFRTDVDLTFVEGDENNDFLDIQDNERDFFEYLKDLIKEGIKLEHNCKSDEEVEDYISKGVGSAMVNDYLLDLCDEALRFNWKHLGCFPVADEDKEDDDDSDSSKDSSDAPQIGWLGWGKAIGDDAKSYEMYMGKNNYIANRDRFSKEGFSFLVVPMLDSERKSPKYEGLERFNILNTLENYLRDVCNSYKYAEALIKFLRWGSRKPRSLWVTGAEKNGVKFVLDLTSRGIHREKINTDNLVPDKDEDGKDITVKSLIWVDAPLSDKAFAMKNEDWCKSRLRFPVGVIYNVSYDNGSTNVDYASDLIAFRDIIRNENRVKYIESEDIIDSTLLEEEAVGDISIWSAIENLASARMQKDENYVVSQGFLEDSDPTSGINNIHQLTNIIPVIGDCLTSTQLESDLRKGDPFSEDTNQGLDWIAQKLSKKEVRSREEAIKWHIAYKYMKVFFNMARGLASGEVTVNDNTCDVKGALNALAWSEKNMPNEGGSGSDADDRVDFNNLDLTARIQQASKRPETPQATVQAKKEVKIVSYRIDQPKDIILYIMGDTDRKIKGLLHKDSVTKVATIYASGEFTLRSETFPQPVKGMSASKVKANIDKGLKVAYYTDETEGKVFN